MNQFEQATKELVTTEVSQFFGSVQGKWNRYMETSVLEFINEKMAKSQDSEFKEEYAFLYRHFKDSHERFCLTSLVDFLQILNKLELGLEVQDSQLRLTTSKKDEDDVYYQIDALYEYFPKF